MKTKTIVVLILLAAKLAIVHAQSQPEIGKPCPDFSLTHVTHYPKKQVTLKDFSGQWLILDFWFTGCTSCIKSLPKISELQHEFVGKVQFLMVGYNDKRFNRNIEEVFEKLRKKQNLNIAAAYDSVLAHHWGIRSMPHIVIVDPNGFVRFITDGRDLTKDKIKKLIEGDYVTFFQKDKVLPDFDPEAMLRGGSIPKDNLLHYSLLTKWNGEAQYAGYEIDRFANIPIRENGYKLAMVNLYWLYNTAYFGKNFFKILGDPLYAEISQYPILELQDTSLFEFDYGLEFGKGLYNYYLYVPVSRVTEENIMHFMQQDLERIFDYRASVEIREMPVWKLVASEKTEKKIITKGGVKYKSTFEESSAAGFTLRNVPMKDFMITLCWYLNEKERYPFIDDTGISGNIDVSINADLTSFQDVKRELKKYEMDFVLSTKTMQVLVIKDH